MGRISATARAIFIGVLALQFTGQVLALPTTVFVYNKKPNNDLNDFDSNAFGFILQELGLLDAFGKPNITEANTIRDAGGNVIGYKSSDGTKEAYDVNANVTTDDAWKRVANGGMLHIIKHGALRLDLIDFEGGGIVLDKDDVFDGFMPVGGTTTGTGAGYVNDPNHLSGPYPLTPRPGANITLNLNGCWTSRDPDGAGPVKPVTATGGDVPGVGSTLGVPGVENTEVIVDVVGGDPNTNKAAKERLREHARKQGFPPKPPDGPQPPTTDADIVRYVKSLPVETRNDTVQKVLDSGVPPVVRIKLTYRKRQAAPPPRPRAVQQPRQVPPSGGDMEFDYNNGDLPQLIAATMHIPAGSLAWPEIFLISMQGELPLPPPAPLVLASGAFFFEARNGGQIVAPLEMSFASNAPPAQTQVLWFDDQLGAWRSPIGSVSMNGQVVTIYSAEMGLYAAFAPASALLTPLPSLSTWAVGVLALLLALTGAALAARAARRRAT